MCFILRWLRRNWPKRPNWPSNSAPCLRTVRPEEFDVWLATARDTELASFAQGLERDYAAVRAALTERWSTSPVEGQINKLKALKRQMFGRAKYDLLRNRLLAA